MHIGSLLNSGVEYFSLSLDTVDDGTASILREKALPILGSRDACVTEATIRELRSKAPIPGGSEPSAPFGLAVHRFSPTVTSHT